VRRRMALPPEPTLRESRLVRNEVERRTLLRGGLVAGAAGAVTVAAGTGVALARRPSADGAPAPDGASGPGGASPSPGPSSPPTGSPASPTTSPSGSAAGAGTVIAPATDVAVGSAKSFTTADGRPAYLLHPSADSFTAFDATCTHQGCPVSFVGPGFRCPCHGATYGADGRVTGGPAPEPLTGIPVKVVDGKVTTA